MFIDNNLESSNRDIIVKTTDGIIKIRLNGSWYTTQQYPAITPYLEEIYAAWKSSNHSPIPEKEQVNAYNVPIILGIINGGAAPASTVSIADAQDAVQKLMDFLSEFHFLPGFRFINTFTKTLLAGGKQKVMSYIAHYFELTDSAYAESIKDKMRSPEFDDIITSFKKFNPSTTVNTRLQIWYGDPGTGKTTQAVKLCNDRCMVCHNGLLPQDLMEDFEFVSGSPVFTPSAFQQAMVNGEKIVLDEINLLPFETLRFLQSVLDGKKQFDYKGQTVTIADGFEVIGTMNLQVGGVTCALPDPLVDRASVLELFEISAGQLVSAVL